MLLTEARKCMQLKDIDLDQCIQVLEFEAVQDNVAAFTSTAGNNYSSVHVLQQPHPRGDALISSRKKGGKEATTNQLFANLLLHAPTSRSSERTTCQRHMAAPQIMLAATSVID